MKAIILKGYGTVDNFEMADLPLPEIQDGTVRIKIKAVSFNPVDYQVRKGLPESRSVTSNVLGRDLSGIVDEVAADVKDFKKGDEVYCYVCHLASSGTYTEYITVPAAIVARKPASLSHEEAASIPVAGITAMIALIKTKTEKAKSIFIAGGAGGVGSFAIMFAKQSGIKDIVTTAGNDKSLQYLLQNFQLRKNQVINYKDHDFIEKAILKNNGFFDIALDLVGGKMLSVCCELIGIDGNLASATEAPNRDDFETLFRKNASFHSIGANAYSLSDNKEQWKAYKYILNHIAKLFDSNAIEIKPPITVVGALSLDTVKKAHELLENNSVQGKLIMTC
ncbi:MAG: NADP-dependent oxidoreductase [Ferruginibacter sp.]